ncbi:MAG: hypothetical protein K2M48_03510 [Clostridiales bacterium]|nr:hypothetical protein [Clostridiales bacterium]
MRNKKLIVLLSIVVSLVLVIIVCGATFLVREIEAYSYYVDSPEEIDAKVISASGISRNSSMFFLDEAGIKNRIEDKCYDIVIDERHYGAEVINIERRFPDKVSINYVVYDELFQYKSSSGEYYRCYASGRISRQVSPTSEDFHDFITVRPGEETTDKPKAYFQKSSGFDRKAIEKFVDYMHTVRVSDKQMPRWVESIDISRDDGYFKYLYIKTAAGCAIELYDTADYFLDNMDALLHYGWSAFADPKPDSIINSSGGKLSVYMNRSTSKPEIRMVYNADYSDDDYRKDYFGA